MFSRYPHKVFDSILLTIVDIVTLKHDVIAIRSLDIPVWHLETEALVFTNYLPTEHPGPIVVEEGVPYLQTTCMYLTHVLSYLISLKSYTTTYGFSDHVPSPPIFSISALYAARGVLK